MRLNHNRVTQSKIQNHSTTDHSFLVDGKRDS